MSASAHVDPWGIRENAYRSNAWMTDEMLGAPRWPLLQRNIDKIMGNLNMIGPRRRRSGPSLHGRSGDGDADPLVRAECGRRPSGLSRDPGDQGRPRRAVEVQLAAQAAHVRLQPLPAAAESEPWLHEPEQPGVGGVSRGIGCRPATTRSRDRGDELFEHAFDDPRIQPGAASSSARSTNSASTMCASARASTIPPCCPRTIRYTGPYADTVPPISEKVNCDPNYLQGLQGRFDRQHDGDDFLGNLQAVDHAADLRQERRLTVRHQPLDKNMVTGSRGESYRPAAGDDVSLPHEVGG